MSSQRLQQAREAMDARAREYWFLEPDPKLGEKLSVEKRYTEDWLIFKGERHWKGVPLRAPRPVEAPGEVPLWALREAAYALFDAVYVPVQLQRRGPPGLPPKVSPRAEEQPA